MFEVELSGTIQLAERTEPVRRRVALKVIKLGIDAQITTVSWDRT